MNPETIGMIAGVLTTFSFLPQTIKTLKAKDTKSISLIMYAMFTTGVALWFAFGLVTHNKPIIIWNAITLPLALTILGKKIYNVKKGRD